MLPSFLLALREGIEAALIIGIVVGSLKKIHRMDLAGTVWLGALAAGVGSFAVAGLITALGASLEGLAEQIFEGVTMLLAAGVLTWMIFWMRRQSLQIKPSIEADVVRVTAQAGTDNRLQGRGPLFGLAFLAIFREGVELALFLSASAFATSWQNTLLGALLGLAAAVGLGWALFSTTVRMNVKGFFAVTSILLILVAAGLVAHGIHEFNEAGLIPGLVSPVWDVNFLLDESSLGGELLKALFGYNANPSLTEMLSYLMYFVMIGLALHRGAGRMIRPA